MVRSGKVGKMGCGTLVIPLAGSRCVAASTQRMVRMLLLLLVIVVTGCATINPPQPIAEVPFVERGQTKTEGTLTVTAAVPTSEENARIFGVDIAGEGIQPVWLRIDNRGDDEYYLFPAAMDPNYFSSYEVAWQAHTLFGGAVNQQLDALFAQHRMPVYIPPRSQSSGFVYTNESLGIKFIKVELRKLGSIKFFNFLINVPGVQTDYQQVDFAALYRPDEIRDVDDEGLRTALEALPCCVLGGDRETLGDPLNIVVIGDGRATFQPFVQQGWDVTETRTTDTIFSTIWSSLFGSRYRTSPVSALYLFDRPQDIALQKARATVDERNHLRLWLTPLRYQSLTVWVGQISRDIGVRLSAKTLVTHKVDPNVDEARFYLLQDLATSGALARLGFVGGVGLAPLDEPRFNYTDDPYHTDGLRLVMVLDDDFVPFEQLTLFPRPPWRSPIDIIRSSLPGSSVLTN